MIDLHVHLDGSLRVKTVFELAKEQNIRLPAHTPEELAGYLKVPEGCRSLTEYLECFRLPLKVLRTQEALERAARELVEDLAAQGLSYAEIRFAPQYSAGEGFSQEQAAAAAVKGMEAALKENPSIRAGLILCCMRGMGKEEANAETLRTAQKFLGGGVAAVDLAGAEGIYPTASYEGLFKMATEMGLPFTIHAGEADGPESVEKALDFGAKRLGHGVRAIESPRLLNRIIKEQVTLEVCPISNLHTKLASDEYSHPIRRLYDMGVRVTVNTDNMTVSDTNLEKEYAFLKKYYQFTDKEIEIMNQYAREAAFLL